MGMEEKVLSSIDQQELLDLTIRLVEIDTQNPPADYSVSSKLMQELYQGLGLETHIFMGEKGKPNVGGRWRGTGEKDDILLLSGHMDVVPIGSDWDIKNPLKPEIRAEVVKQTHLSVSERFRSARHPLYKSNRIALFEPVMDELVKPEFETNPCNFTIIE